MKTKAQKREAFDALAPQRDYWRNRSRYYHEQLASLVRHLVPPDVRVLEVGCATGDLLGQLDNRDVTGVDFSAEMIRLAREKFPHMEFRQQDAEALEPGDLPGAPYDYVIMSDLIGELDDVQVAFEQLHKVTHEKSRVVITYYNYLWELAVRIAEKYHVKMPQDCQNWLSLEDIDNLLKLSGFEVVKKGYRLLLPFRVPVLSALFNRFFAILPGLKKLCLTEYVVARKVPIPDTEHTLTTTVLIPTRNEAGNIEAAIRRLPPLGAHTEIIFVDGSSTDGTVEKIEEMIASHPDMDIKLIHQIPRDVAADSELAADLKTPPHKMLKLGKGDAVRKGFDAATGDILMILDSDLTVPPEDLPKFYEAIAQGHGEFINGTRLVYQMEDQAMRTLNLFGNKFFSLVFTWLLEQRIKDTLCGTKVLLKSDYERIKANRSYFGDFDPFGDFDLLFGAAKQNMKIIEVPIRYRERTYGTIKIERFKHGILLLKMSWIAFKKLKLIA